MGMVKTEHPTRARFRIAFVPEESLDAGGLVVKGQGRVGFQKVRQILPVATGLLGDHRKCRSFLIRLRNAHRLAVHDQQIVAATHGKGHFAQGDATRSRR